MHIQAIVVKARELVAERVNFKCRVPLCSHYGVNLMCPPNVPTPAETRGALARYSDTLVVQRAIPLTQDAVDEALAGMGYAEANAVPRGAAGTSAAAAGRKGGEACRRPFEARPSMEAVGIDVVATAEAAGLAIEMPAADKPCWTGLLLI